MEPRFKLTEASKGFLDGLIKTSTFLHQSGLDPKLMELVYYRVSQINGCAYCLDMHHKEAIHKGETELRLHTLAAWKECPYFTDTERAVLTFAEAMLKGDVEDSVYKALEGSFSKEEIAVITLAVATINCWNMLNITFRSTPGNYQVSQLMTGKAVAH